MSSAGLVPAPQAGQQDYFLRSDNVWAEKNGTDKFLCANGNWEIGNNNNLFLKGDASWSNMNLVAPPSLTFKRDDNLFQYAGTAYPITLKIDGEYIKDSILEVTNNLSSAASFSINLPDTSFYSSVEIIRNDKNLPIGERYFLTEKAFTESFSFFIRQNSNYAGEINLNAIIKTKNGDSNIQIVPLKWGARPSISFSPTSITLGAKTNTTVKKASVTVTVNNPDKVAAWINFDSYFQGFAQGDSQCIVATPNIVYSRDNNIKLYTVFSGATDVGNAKGVISIDCSSSTSKQFTVTYERNTNYSMAGDVGTKQITYGITFEKAKVNNRYSTSVPYTRFNLVLENN